MIATSLIIINGIILVVGFVGGQRGGALSVLEATVRRLTAFTAATFRRSRFETAAWRFERRTWYIEIRFRAAAVEAAARRMTLTQTATGAIGRQVFDAVAR